jgi:diadenosine tetraphosphate (Ap4A) HIT family hydrolase
VIGDTQFHPGYCLLLADPPVSDLHNMAHQDRVQFLSDMAHLGEVVQRLTGAARINYEMLGNVEPALHAHVFPRYAHEEDGLRQSPVWSYDAAVRDAKPFDPTRDRPFMDQVAAELREAGVASL